MTKQSQKVLWHALGSVFDVIMLDAFSELTIMEHAHDKDDRSNQKAH